MRRNETRRRRPTFLLLLLGLVAAGFFYLRCGEGLGFGPGSGEGDGDSDGARTADRRADPKDPMRPAAGSTGERCKLRLDATGLQLEGKPITAAKAAQTCKASGAELVVTGDAEEGARKRALAELERAGVQVLTREPTGGGSTERPPF